MPDLTPDALQFLAERHLATLTSLRADGTPHVVPVGFTWDAARGVATVITSGGSVKARLAQGGGTVAVCQVDGARWLTLEGPVTVRGDAETVAGAEARYAARYRPPRVNPQRVALDIEVRRALGSRGMLSGR